MLRLFYLAALLSITCDVQAASVSSAICTKRNSYLDVGGSCDAYIECRDFKPTEKLCLDGLHYRPEAQWPEYPCGYPSDVTCVGRGAAQPANPTADCPHQYGFFKSPNAAVNECGKYRMCVEGKAIDMDCPFGLAFNPDTARCDWPGLVPSCKSDDFLGFKCPTGENDGSGNPIVTNHKYGSDCFYFFSCKNGEARILSCDPGFAFNSITGRCENADEVSCGNSSAITP